MFILLVFLVVQESFLGDNSYFRFFFFLVAGWMLEKGQIWILTNVRGRSLSRNALDILDLYVPFFLFSQFCFYMFLGISNISFFWVSAREGRV